MAAKIKTNKEYDAVFINPQMDDLLEAIANQKNAGNTLLVFEKNLQRKDYFQTTQTFPYHIRSFMGKIKEQKNWRKLFKLAPHLVHSQKVLYLSKPSRIEIRAKIFDYLYKNRYSKQYRTLDIARPEYFKFLNYSRLRGILFHEYKVNISRLFIEILKYFEILDGQIIFDNRKLNRITSKVHPKKTEKKRGYEIPVKCKSDFGIVTRCNDVSICVDLANGVPVIHQYGQAGINKKMFNPPGKIVQAEFLLNATEKEFDTNEYLSANTINKIVKVIDEPLPCSAGGSTVEDNYEICLEKYDIAKQTGISYEDFKVLFHRFGSGMDEITEEAYLLMNKIRDPQKLWTLAQDIFMKKYEWKKDKNSN